MSPFAGRGGAGERPLPSRRDHSFEKGGCAMKKMRRLLALAAACAVLSGCSLLERSYGAVEAHSRKYWESEAETTLRADNYQDMVNDLLHGNRFIAVLLKV